MYPLQLGGEGGGGVKTFRKSLCLGGEGVRNFNFGGGGGVGGWRGSHNFEFKTG